MPGLKVVALISGGKDSLFSILHCIANGHEVVALANLHPPLEEGKQQDDMDSFMYQTIGHAIIPLYEQALGLPLFRQEILGTAVNQDKSYSAVASDEDETESLTPLLQKVMAAHPEVNAVSTGAILSDYQRTRVESVALRLGLTPLSYLWQFPFLPPNQEASLLDDMTAVGQDARIIKVASGGLDDSFIWNNVADNRTKTRLRRAMERFGVAGGGAALGEGGEYETLAIDGPAPLWKASICIEEGARTVVSGEGGTASVQIKHAKVLPKEAGFEHRPSEVRKPSLLDPSFESTLTGLAEITPLNTKKQTEAQLTPIDFPTWQSRTIGDVKLIANAVAEGTNAMGQMNGILQQLHSDYQIAPEAIAFTTILLRSMSDFASVNASYGAFFTKPNPPARVTIACGNNLPAGVLVSLSIIAVSGPTLKARRGLHVQSRSYWAPANIGPYSQAIAIPTKSLDGEEKLPMLVHVAGQIPLIPPSMELPEAESSTPEADFRLQATLSLQHLWRIGRRMDVEAWLGAVAVLAAETGPGNVSRVATALGAWELAHRGTSHERDSGDESDDGVDVWDLTHRGALPRGHGAGQSSSQPGMSCFTGGSIPPCFVVEVESLPRNATIEWASSGLTSCAGSISARSGTSKDAIWHVLETEQSVQAGWVALGDLGALEDLESMVGLPKEATSECIFTLYTADEVPHQWASQRGALIIPCRRLWDSEGKQVKAIVMFRQVTP